MKIALVYPEVYELARYISRKEKPPIGLLYLASVIEKRDYNVTIISVNHDYYSIDFSDFDIVGFSIPASITLSLILKVRFNSTFSLNSLIIIGGVHATIYPVETFLTLKADVLFIGEAEESIAEFFEALERGYELDNIDGIVFSKHDETVITRKRNTLIDINSIPLPARHLLPIEDIIMNNRLSNTELRMTHVIFSRGCPFNCSFCFNISSSIRYRSSENIRDELLQLKNDYQIEGFFVNDSNFIVNESDVISICNSIKDLKLKWAANCRVDKINTELLDILFISGCIELRFGIESGSQKILDAMNKQITIDKIKNSIMQTYRAGIKVKVFVQHGFPGENEVSTNETISLLNEMNQYINRVSLFRFVPVPGSNIYENTTNNILHNTKYSANWDKSYDNCHFHRNNTHWWGTSEEHKQMMESYSKLSLFIKDNWK